MAPKNLPPSAKQAKILNWFRETAGVYTLKDLEKYLPSIGSINQMQVKEYVQALQDENLIRVEKIGSGNWYWCFVSDGRKDRERVLEGLRGEETRLGDAIRETEKAIAEERRGREDEVGDDDDGEMLEDGGRLDRKALLEVYEVQLWEQQTLERELALYSECDPAAVQRLVLETKKAREGAMRWTDNIEAVESFMVRQIGDRAAVAGVMAQACGEEYIVGEGLKEL